MITAPAKLTEWKLDRVENGGVLKKVSGLRIEKKGSVYFDERFHEYCIAFQFDTPQYTGCLEDALDILWGLRNRLTHHKLCKCATCIWQRERPFASDSEEDDHEPCI